MIRCWFKRGPLVPFQLDWPNDHEDPSAEYRASIAQHRWVEIVGTAQGGAAHFAAGELDKGDGE